MTRSLDRSVTLRDVLDLVETRRVPMAPELAGYLCLELAGRAAVQPGGLTLECVWLGEGGSVAFVPAESTQPPAWFVRQALRRLLEPSASKPAALWAVAQGDGRDLAALQQQLEAALVPLNRPASQRSLARLALQVHRVTDGVGRNATAARIAPHDGAATRATPSPAAVLAPSAPPPAARPWSEPPASAAAPSAHEPAAPAPAGPAPAASADSAPAGESLAKASQEPQDELDEQPTELDGVHTMARPLESEPAPPAAPAADPWLAQLSHEADDAADDARRDDARRELKQLAGLEPTPPPAALESLPEAQSPAPSETSTRVHTVLASEPLPEAAPSSSDLRDVDAVLREAEERSTARPGAAEVQRLATATRESNDIPPRTRIPTPVELRPSGAPKALRAKLARALSLGALCLFLLAFVLVYWLRPHWMLGHPIETSPPPAPTEAPPPAPAPHCALKLQSARAGAEILLRQGTAPLDVTPMPAGARIEFVATLDGFSPKRAVVPAQARWDRDGSGRPRYELALEMAPLRKTASRWPLAEAGTTVGGEGEPGTVRVISSPRDAEIWLLFGAGPDAALEPIPCTDHELLIAPTDAKGQGAPLRVSVAKEEFVLDRATGVASATVSLAADAGP